MSLSAHTLPDVWRASELARPPGLVLPTGHAALDAALPGGGWPVGGISELLQAPGLHAEWGLLAPALRQLAAQAQAPRSGRSAVVLIGAPWLPFGPALAARGCVPGSLLQVQVDTLADRLWAAEQALRCADVPAVLLWLGAVPAAALRRLQTLAQEHGRLLFVCRPPSARQEASPAPLRLSLDWPQAQAEACGRLPALQVEVFKRRGPPLAAPLLLQMQPSALQQLLAASHGLARRRRARLVQTLALSEVSDAVDRAQSLA